MIRQRFLNLHHLIPGYGHPNEHKVYRVGINDSTQVGRGGMYFCDILDEAGSKTSREGMINEFDNKTKLMPPTL